MKQKSDVTDVKWIVVEGRCETRLSPNCSFPVAMSARLHLQWRTHDDQSCQLRGYHSRHRKAKLRQTLFARHKSV